MLSIGRKAISTTVNSVVDKCIRKITNSSKLVHSSKTAPGARKYYTDMANHFRIKSDNGVLKLQSEYSYPHSMQSRWDDVVSRIYEQGGKKVTTRYDKRLIDGQFDRVDVRTKNGKKTKIETSYVDKDIKLSPEQYLQYTIQNKIKEIVQNAKSGIRDLFRIFPTVE